MAGAFVRRIEPTLYSSCERGSETMFGDLRSTLATMAADIARVAADVAYLRGRQDERDRQ